jgi:hypothetical protein
LQPIFILQNYRLVSTKCTIITYLSPYPPFYISIFLTLLHTLPSPSNKKRKSVCRIIKNVCFQKKLINNYTPFRRLVHCSTTRLYLSRKRGFCTAPSIWIATTTMFYSCVRWTLVLFIFVKCSKHDGTLATIVSGKILNKVINYLFISVLFHSC